MENRLFLGIDGGQTSTLAVLCDERGSLLGIGHAGPSNHIHEPGGMARMENALTLSIHKAFSQAGWRGSKDELPEIAAACCGMTGGIEVIPELFERIARTKNLIVEYDLITAHAGALCGDLGIVVIAGTGSVAFGVNRRRQSARAGGWAHIMGDEGSAYDLGRQALIAAARVEDGRGPVTSLHDYILTHFHQVSLWDIRTKIYSGEIDRRGIAQLARLVIAAANEGDTVAQGILKKGIIELSDITVAVMTQLQMDHEETLVATVGGLFQAGSIISDPFSNELHKYNPQAKIISPYYQPVIGAVLLALRAVNIPLDSHLKEHLRHSDQKLGEKEEKF